ncbi:MAG TPA: S26 family signal peptidase [Thermoplasmata archaeon]|jgi:signal peptidase|nr:S26 family signal peptidase [Thermoplasmata archaeon]
MRWWPLPWPKAWAGEKPADEEDEEPKTLREQILLFARDLAFAFLIVAIVMGLLFGYTRVWPPMVVVESDSMQHSDTEGFVGAIDTGDLVLVQAVSQHSDVTTYVEARNAGYETYSNFGDVIVFNKPLALPGATPIIHRAIVYVVPNPGGDGVDVPSLAGRPVGVEWDGIWVNSTPATTPFGLASLTIKGVRSWDLEAGGRRDITYPNLNAVTNDGFLTKGDHNQQPDQWGAPVAVGRIIGKARGELPWFGLIKLTLSPGPTGCCRQGWGDPAAPANSWNSLLVSLILIIVGPFAADFAWGWWKDRRKERKTDAEAAPPDPEEAAPERPESSDPPTGDPTDEARTGSAGPGAGGP